MTLSGSSPIGNSWRLYDSTSSPSWLSPDEIGITGEPDLQFNIWGSAMMTTGNFHIQNSRIGWEKRPIKLNKLDDPTSSTNNEIISHFECGIQIDPIHTVKF
jgi:hypothetical protein